jgi:hypothetical protein
VIVHTDAMQNHVFPSRVGEEFCQRSSVALKG